MKAFLCSFLLIAVTLSVAAKEYAMLHYTKAEGLPGNAVYDMYQDKRGYLWLATNAGVSRYNGIRFENFTTGDGLPDNECFFFREDPYGRMWIATYSGALLYYRDGTFHTARNSSLLRLPFKTGPFRNIRIEADSSVSFVFATIPVFLSIKGGQRKIYNLSRIQEINRLDSNFAVGKIINIRREYGTIKVVYGAGTLWLDEGLKMLDRAIFKGGTLYWLCSTPRDEYLMAGNKVYDGALNVFRTLPAKMIGNANIYKVREYHGTTFTGTNRGLWIDSVRILENVMISNVFCDKDNNYWICTLNDGIYKLSYAFRDMLYYREVAGSQVVFASGRKDALLLGSRNRNLYYLTAAGPRQLVDFGRVTGHIVWSSKIGYYADKKYLLSFADQKNYVFDRERPSRSYRKEFQRALLASKIFYKSPYLYLFSGLFIDLVTYKRLLSDRSVPTSRMALPGLREPPAIFGVAQAADSSIWLSMENKLFRITDTVLQLQQEFDDIRFREFIFTKHALIGYTVDNRLLVVHHYNNSRIRIDSATRNDVVWDKFYPVNDSMVILATNKLYRIVITTPAGYRIRILEHPFLPQGPEYVYSDGNLCYFFKDRSLTGIPLQQLLNGPAAPVLRFGNIKAQHLTLPVDTVTELAYRLSRDIRIAFTATSFDVPDPAFEYSITSSGTPYEKWQKTAGEHISLYNISPGMYRIKIRALTASGVSSNVLECTLVIKNPFWLQWWFLLLAGFFLLLLLTAIFRWYLRKQARMRNQEMKFLKSEFIALNALMNPHFVFNSLNSVQSLVVGNDTEAAARYIRTFSDLIRQNMHNLSADRITLEREMMLVANYLELEQLRFKEWLDYDISIGDEVEADLILVPPLLVQPLVENAIKHGLWAGKVRQGFLKIVITETEELVEITITDNGGGLGNKSEEQGGHQSQALTNIRSRLDKLSRIHRQHIVLDISELRDKHNEVTGVCSRLRLYAGRAG